MSIKAKELISLMNRWAPPSLAEKWDNPGLQVGSPETIVKRVMIALDVTKENVEYAIKHQVDMIISHHPLIFKPLYGINSEEPKGKLITSLLTNNIVSFAAHTNLDSAEEGVNDALAHVLKLTNCIGFVPVRQEVIYELSLHGYAQNESQLKELFSSFQMLLKHDSYQDMIHYSIKVQEGDINKVKEILIKGEEYIHSFEWHKLAHNGHLYTMGRIGELPHIMDGKDALQYIKNCLKIPVLKYSGNSNKRISKIAILGGSGADFAQMAKNIGADMYITGDVKYHQGQDAAASGLLIVDGCHFYTEHVIVPYLAQRLRREAIAKNWDIEWVEDPVAKDIFEYVI